MKLPSFLANILKFFRQCRVGRNLYKYKFVEDFPHHFNGRLVYVIGSLKEPWQIAFICPCGCGEAIQLYTNKASSPRWDIKFEQHQTVSLTPSVFRTRSCRAHFFLKHGKVHWCH